MFDVSKFTEAKLSQRTAEVPLPELAEFFDSAENAKAVVRALSGEELAIVREAAARNHAARDALQAMQAGGDVSEAVKSAIAVLVGATGGKTVPDEHARFLEVVRLGLVSPVLDHQQVVKLAMFYPVQFQVLANRIFTLSGMGAESKKPQPSTETQG